MTTEIKKSSDDEFGEIIDRRRRNRMDAVDRLPAEHRQCVHDYGWNVVKAYLDIGIKNPRHIRHLVETVLNEFSPTRGSSSAQGIRAAKGMREEP